MEYAVEMTRFDERQTLDHLAEAAAPDPDLVAATADAIAASHAAAPPTAANPWIDSIPPIIADNSAAFRAAGCLLDAEVDRLDRASRAAFSAVRALLERRGGQGFVRRCHGDLHLANVVLIEAKPVLFDAIEFDPLIASVDVLYDLAFPMMDFLHYGRRARRRQRPAQPLSRHDLRRPYRRARGAAAVHVAARGNPRKGAAGAAWPDG